MATGRSPQFSDYFHSAYTGPFQTSARHLTHISAQETQLMPTAVRDLCQHEFLNSLHYLQTGRTDFGWVDLPRAYQLSSSLLYPIQNSAVHHILMHHHLISSLVSLKKAYVAVCRYSRLQSGDTVTCSGFRLSRKSTQYTRALRQKHALESSLDELRECNSRPPPSHRSTLVTCSCSALAHIDVAVH